jgi:hypothetical protein
MILKTMIMMIYSNNKITDPLNFKNLILGFLYESLL